MLNQGKAIHFIKEYWLYIFAVAAETSTLFVNFLLFALIQHRFGVEQLSLYMIIRRAISMILPVVMLGIPLSLIKHIGAISDHRQITRYIWPGILLPMLIASCFLIIGATNPGLLSRLLLGNKDYAGYMMPSLFLVLSTAVVLTLIAVSKGLHKISLASALYIIFFSLAPLGAYFLSKSLSGFLMIYGLLIFVSGIALLLYVILSLEGSAPVFTGHVTFITFGLKGAASEFLMMFILWLPPFIIASSDAIKISGYFSLMMSLILVAGSPLAPIGSATMPKVARALHMKNIDDVNKLFKKIFKLLFMISVPAFMAILLMYGTIANYLLHDSPPMGNKATMVMLTSSMPISAYFGLRNMVDVGYSPMRNMLNIFIGLIVFLICFFVILAVNPLAIRIAVVVGFTVAIWILGGLTTYYSYQVSRHCS